MGGRREAVSPCVNENELVPFDLLGLATGFGDGEGSDGGRGGG